MPSITLPPMPPICMDCKACPCDCGEPIWTYAYKRDSMDAPEFNDRGAGHYWTRAVAVRMLMEAPRDNFHGPVQRHTEPMPVRLTRGAEYWSSRTVIGQALTTAGNSGADVLLQLGAATTLKATAKRHLKAGAMVAIDDVEVADEVAVLDTSKGSTTMTLPAPMPVDDKFPVSVKQYVEWQREYMGTWPDPKWGICVRASDWRWFRHRDMPGNVGGSCDVATFDKESDAVEFARRALPMTVAWAVVPWGDYKGADEAVRIAQERRATPAANPPPAPVKLTAYEIISRTTWEAYRSHLDRILHAMSEIMLPKCPALNSRIASITSVGGPVSTHATIPDGYYYKAVYPDEVPCALPWCDRKWRQGQDPSGNASWDLCCSTLCLDTKRKLDAINRRVNDFNARVAARKLPDARMQSERQWTTLRVQGEVDALMQRWHALRHEPLQGNEGLWPICEDSEE